MGLWEFNGDFFDKKNSFFAKSIDTDPGDPEWPWTGNRPYFAFFSPNSTALEAMGCLWVWDGMGTDSQSPRQPCSYKQNSPVEVGRVSEAG